MECQQQIELIKIVVIANEYDFFLQTRIKKKRKKKANFNREKSLRLQLVQSTSDRNVK